MTARGSPFFTLSPFFLQSTSPTLKSMELSFVSLPPPKNRQILPISSVRISLTKPSVSAQTVS